MRPRSPPGTTSTSSPTRTDPSTSVPVTTVPKPVIVKARSIGRRGRPRSRRGGAAPRTDSSDARSTSSPRRVVAETSTMGASASGVRPSAGADLGAHERDPLVVDQVTLAQDDHPAIDSEELEDRQVLARLGHHALVGRHDEHHRVDAADAGEHVADEVLMAGHVDDADVRATRQREPREAEVDGHAALALLAKPVGVDAGERADERRLAVIDVAGRPDDADRRVAGHCTPGVGPQVANSAGTTTKASTTRPVTQRARTIPVARSGSGCRGPLPTRGSRRIRSPPGSRAAARRRPRSSGPAGARRTVSRRPRSSPRSR